METRGVSDFGPQASGGLEILKPEVWGLRPSFKSNLLQINATGVNEAVAEHIDRSLRLLERDVSDQGLVNAILRSHFKKEDLAHHRRKAFNLDSNRAADVAFEDFLRSGLGFDSSDDRRIP